MCVCVCVCGCGCVGVFEPRNATTTSTMSGTDRPKTRKYTRWDCDVPLLRGIPSGFPASQKSQNRQRLGGGDVLCTDQNMENAVCTVCSQRLHAEYDNDLDDWVYRDATEVLGHVHHYQCLLALRLDELPGKVHKHRELP